MQMSSSPLLAAQMTDSKEHFKPEDESELNITNQKPLQYSTLDGSLSSKYYFTFQNSLSVFSDGRVHFFFRLFLTENSHTLKTLLSLN